MDPIIIKLRYPVTQGSEVVSEIRFTRRPKVDDLRDTSSADEVGRSRKLISRLAGVPESVVKEIDLEDFTEINQVIDGFLSSGPKDGSAQ
jgi:hypothetical protein